MRTYFLSTFFWLFAISLAWSQNFEGIVEMSKETEGIQQNIKWYIRKDKVAFEISADKDNPTAMYRFVPQPEKGTLLLIATADNSKLEVATDDNNINSKFDTKNLQIEDKGASSSSLANFKETQKWLISNTSGYVTEANISTEIDVDFSKYAKYFKEDYSLQALAQSHKKGFPLSATTRDKNGAIVSKVIVTKVTKTKLNDSYFK